MFEKSAFFLILAHEDIFSEQKFRLVNAIWLILTLRTELMLETNDGCHGVWYIHTTGSSLSLSLPDCLLKVSITPLPLYQTIY